MSSDDRTRSPDVPAVPCIWQVPPDDLRRKWPAVPAAAGVDCSQGRPRPDICPLPPLAGFSQSLGRVISARRTPESDAAGLAGGGPDRISSRGLVPIDASNWLALSSRTSPLSWIVMNYSIENADVGQTGWGQFAPLDSQISKRREPEPPPQKPRLVSRHPKALRIEAVWSLQVIR